MRSRWLIVGVLGLACSRTTSDAPQPTTKAEQLAIAEPGPKVDAPVPAAEAKAELKSEANAGPTPEPNPEPNPEPTPEPNRKPSPEPSPGVTGVANVKAFRFVNSQSSGFPNTSGDDAPHLAMEIDHPEGEREVLAQRALEDDEGTVTPKASELKAPEVVWMFGPEGPCRARLGKPYATASEDVNLILEVGFRLDPCTKDYAPVAFLGAEPPPARWRSATTEVSKKLRNPKRWKHPARATLVAHGLLEWDSEEQPRPPVVYARIRSAGAIAELGYAHHWPGDECEEEQSISTTLGRWDGKRFDALPKISEYADEPELIGTLELDGAPWVVIADDHYQMQFGAFDGSKVTWTEIITGEYHDEDTAYWGWSVLESECGP